MRDFEMLLLKYGLVQFGRFAVPGGDGQTLPFKLNLDLLTCYPDALAVAADEVVQGMAVHHVQVERLLCPFDALPLATVVSHKSGVPLVYSRGRGEAVVRDLVGAYDLDHPTLFITNAYVPWENHSVLLRAAQRVGLRTTDAFALVDCGNPTRAKAGRINWLGLFSVDVVAHVGQVNGVIPERVVEQVTRWYLGGEGV
jgi:hypothetical protein